MTFYQKNQTIIDAQQYRENRDIFKKILSTIFVLSELNNKSSVNLIVDAILKIFSWF